MTHSLRTWIGLAGILLATSLPGQAAQRPGPIESLTLKEIISRLDQVDFDLQGLQGHINEFRKDVSAGLGNAAAIRVLDIGVGLVRDRVQLNRLPQLIGAMQRESRTDSWQRGRQEEQMKRQNALLARHGDLYRVVEGYAADVKEKFGIDLKGFLDAVEAAEQRGDNNVDAVVQQFRDAVYKGDTSRTAQLTQALTTGAPVPPPSSSSGSSTQGMNNSASSTVVSAMPDPNKPGYYIVRYADGHTESVAGTDNGDGTVTLNLPNGQSVTTRLTGGSAGMNGPGGEGGAGGVSSGGPNSGSMAGSGGNTASSGGGSLAPNVRAGPGGGYIVTETLPDGTQVEHYFPANLQGIGTKYLGDQGSRLTEETKETFDKSTGQIQKGQAVRWQFAITPTGQSPEPSGGVRATFKLVDRAGQGKFTVTGWKISGPDGSVVANGAGEEATGVATQSGNYRVEFSGNTEWGSPFRIEVQIPIAVN